VRERIIVKPLGDAVSTNMIVVTDVRRYIFLLDPNGEGGQACSFFASPIPTPMCPMPRRPHSVATYKLSGARSLFPSSMRDDGRRTTITWGDQTALPAVFAVGEAARRASSTAG
jgi:type IV secretion system protein VirB9